MVVWDSCKPRTGSVIMPVRPDPTESDSAESPDSVTEVHDWLRVRVRFDKRRPPTVFSGTSTIDQTLPGLPPE